MKAQTLNWQKLSLVGIPVSAIVTFLMTIFLIQTSNYQCNDSNNNHIYVTLNDNNDNNANNNNQPNLNNALQQFQNHFDGDIFTAKDKGYENACNNGNPLFNFHRPLIFFYPKNIESLKRVLKFCNKWKLHPRIRSHGHSMAGCHFTVCFFKFFFVCFLCFFVMFLQSTNTPKKKQKAKNKNKKNGCVKVTVRAV